MKNFVKILSLLFVLLFISFTGAYALKWNRATIMIYVPKDEVYAPLMQSAVYQWQGYTHRKLAFWITHEPRDLRLVEVETVFNKNTDANAANYGSVNYTASSNFYRHAKITININENPEILNNPEKNNENIAEIYTVMVKQVGKMLGVPESQDPNSAMYSKYQQGQKIMPSDCENLDKVYGWTANKKVKH